MELIHFISDGFNPMNEMFERVGASVATCLERVKLLLTDVEPGYRVLADISALEEMQASCAGKAGRENRASRASSTEGHRFQSHGAISLWWGGSILDR